MSEVTKPILLDETGQSIVTKLDEIKNAILSDVPAGEPVRITVVTPPTTTEYTIGDTVDLTGIEVCAIFTNNAVIDITDQCTFSPAQGEVAAGDVITASWTWEPTPQTFTATTPIEVQYVTWASGTNAQIKAMLDAHYAGLINIHDFWNVGDKREANTPEIPASEVAESYYGGGNNYLVLLNEGGKELVTPINGVSECAYVVGFDDVIWGYNSSTPTAPYAEFDDYNGDADYPSDPYTGNWSTCTRRAWCNQVFKTYFAEYNTLGNLFKLFKNISAADYSTNTVQTQDYWSLYAEKELFGSNTKGDATAEASLRQFKYYETSSNRYKGYTANDETTYCEYWTRTLAKYSYSASEYKTNIAHVLTPGSSYDVGTISPARTDNDRVAIYGVI